MSMVSDSQRPADRYITTFGVRYIAIDPAVGFVLNGKPINLDGVDRRQDYGFLGDAVPEVVGERDIQLIKGMGRTSCARRIIRRIRQSSPNVTGWES